MSKWEKLCLHPFLSLKIKAEGYIAPCCVFNPLTDDDGKMISVVTSGVEEGWNSVAMQGIRKAFIEGSPPKDCSYCFDHEAAGGGSMRKQMHEAWNAGYCNSGNETADDLVAEAVSNNFSMKRGPEWLELDLGNQCNLKCRMCNPFYSSFISRDVVQSSWAEPTGSGCYDPAVVRKDWSTNRDFIEQDLLYKINDVRKLHLMGGEPFMMKQVVYILQRIVDLGAAKNIILSISTNATIRNELLCEIFTQFKSVALSISVDGTEEVAEYIRYPSKWKMVESNISRLKQIENAYAFVNMTLQVYNMFHVTPVAQFCEDMNIDFRYHLMTRPACLHHQCMPLDVRQAAANKIRQFNLDMSKDRFQGRVIDTNSVLDEIAGLLESNSGPTDPAMVEQFMEFTNDLDASRGQSFSAANGELADLLGKSGFPWSDRRRFTTCDTGAAPL